MQAIQIYQVTSEPFFKFANSIETYEDFKNLNINLLGLKLKKPAIIKIKQSLHNNFNFMKIVDSEKFQVKIEKLKKGNKLEIKLIFSKN